MQIYTRQLRVRHYEIDVLGHVNNGVYQNYLEQAKEILTTFKSIQPSDN